MSEEFQTATHPNQFALEKSMRTLVETGGPSPLMQAVQMLRLWFGRPSFSPKEYFLYRMYQPEDFKRVKSTFVSYSENTELCRSLSRPEARERYIDVFQNKLTFEDRMAEIGVPTVRTKAVFGPCDGDRHHRLASRADIEDFLRDASNYPFFGKPTGSSHSLGVLSFDALLDDGETIRLATGHEVALTKVAAHIADTWHAGYLFQDREKNHESLRRFMGDAIGCARIVTILGLDGPEILYALQKIPAKGMIHDNSTSTAKGAVCPISKDGVLGRISGFQTYGATDSDYWQDTKTPVTGTVLPNWEKVVEICRAAHASMPGMGMVGFDVMHTDRGPILGEMNGNPFFSLLQGSIQVGGKSPEFLARYEIARRMSGAARA